MPEINSKPVKKEEFEVDEDDDKSIANKRKRPNTATESQPKVKKELNKVKKEEADESVEDSSSKSATKKVQKKNVKEEVEPKKKKGGKENDATDDKKRIKKAYDFPGQKRDPPQERDPLRIFYQTLYEQVPSSEMAAIWMMESGLLPKDVAKKVFERKQKKAQQQRLSSPMKTVVTVKKNPDSVTIQKKSSTTQNKKTTSETKTHQMKKRKMKDESEDNGDFVLDAKKA